VLVVALAGLPYLIGTGTVQPLVTLFLLVSMAALWNLPAGYAGMISFGQQAYLGIGAYILYLVSRATRDEPAAAAATGVEVQRTRWLAYVLAAMGFGAVGGMLIISNLYTDPGTVVAIGVVLVVPGGLWDFAARRGWSLLPVGYRVRGPASDDRKGA
jgi:ABC-type branched-subunit amino acid transport system permease subunit